MVMAGQSHGAPLQVDCQSVGRFPYQPSREESAIFEYVFFPQKSRAQKSLDGDANANDTKPGPCIGTLNCLIGAVPRLIAYILLLVNAGSITYSLVMASLWNGSVDVDQEDKSSESLVAMAAVVEGVMLFCAVIKVVYFSVQLWASTGEYCIAHECNSSGSRSSSNLLHDAHWSPTAVTVGIQFVWNRATRRLRPGCIHNICSQVCSYSLT